MAAVKGIAFRISLVTDPQVLLSEMVELNGNLLPIMGDCGHVIMLLASRRMN